MCIILWRKLIYRCLLYLKYNSIFIFNYFYIVLRKYLLSFAKTITLYWMANNNKKNGFQNVFLEKVQKNLNTFIRPISQMRNSISHIELFFVVVNFWISLCNISFFKCYFLYIFMPTHNFKLQIMSCTEFEISRMSFTMESIKFQKWRTLFPPSSKNGDAKIPRCHFERFF